MVQYVHDYNRKPGALIVRKLANMLVPRKRHRMLNHGTKLFVMGGQCSSVEVFDILTEQWTLYTGEMFTQSLHVALYFWLKLPRVPLIANKHSLDGEFLALILRGLPSPSSWDCTTLGGGALGRQP